MYIQERAVCSGSNPLHFLHSSNSSMCLCFIEMILFALVINKYTANTLNKFLTQFTSWLSVSVVGKSDFTMVKNIKLKHELFFCLLFCSLHWQLIV